MGTSQGREDRAELIWYRETRQVKDPLVWVGPMSGMVVEATRSGA